MKKIINIALLGLLIAMATGCTGSLGLTRKYHAWHRGMDNKWADEGIFFASIVIPVYFVTTFGDAVIFNSMEFWGEENPITATEKPYGDELCLTD